jgi:hypothetical protein
MMRGAIPEDIPHSFFEGAERVLGANDEEWHILCWAYLEPGPISKLPRGRDFRWRLERALKRWEGFAAVEELTEEEASSEQRLWWRVRRDVGNAAHDLER